MSEIPEQLQELVSESLTFVEVCEASRMPDGFYLVTVQDHVNTDLFRKIEEADGVEYFSIRAPYPAEERAHSVKVLKMMVTVDR